MIQTGGSFAGQALACVRGGRRVFDGVAFAVEAGGALLLTGPNGAGKSSLLRMMAGLTPPASGRLTWNGEAVADDREAHCARLHYLGHHEGVKPVLTVAENLRYWTGLREAGLPPERLEGALRRFGVDRLAELPGRLLSSGQRRRLALARLPAVPAPLWLLDEPTVGLDSESVLALETLLAEHRAGGGMVVLATHAPIALPGAHRLHLQRRSAPPAGPESVP